MTIVFILYIINDLLATVLLSHGSPNPFVLLVAPVVKPNLPTDPHIPLQTILSSRVFAINIINLYLQPRPFMVKSSSDCPRRQWNTINNILHRKIVKSTSIICLSVLASQFATFFILQRENLATPPDTVHQPSSGCSLSFTSGTTSRLQHPSSCNRR